MKIVFISDTHAKHKGFNFDEEIYNDIDTIVHCGDFSHSLKQFYEFMEWYSDQPFKNKILIPGNHEECVQADEDMFYRACKEFGIIGLIDKEVIIDGVKFYGTPWTPMFYEWAYMEEDYLLDKHWDKIPTDTNVLITHGPTYGILDVVNDYGRVIHTGSETLGDAISNLKELKVQAFGHIHEGRGMYRENKVDYLNVASVNTLYKLQPAVIYDYKD